MLALMFVVASLVLSLSVALPRVRLEIRRDQELETVHRGQQYIRAVQLYYRKFHAYPPSTDALVETNGMHFLRKKYIDPMTGKDDWQPIMLGQNKAPTAIGFFGQPLGLAGLTQAPGPSILPLEAMRWSALRTARMQGALTQAMDRTQLPGQQHRAKSMEEPALSAFHPAVSSRRSWSTKPRIATTNGSSCTTRLRTGVSEASSPCFRSRDRPPTLESWHELRLVGRESGSWQSSVLSR